MRKKDIKPIWPAEVRGGKIHIHARKEFDLYVSTNFEGEKVGVIVQEVKRGRSLKQNGYYWGVIIPIASDEMGVTPMEAHHILGDEFLRYEKTLSDGRKRTLVRSTSDLNTAEAEDYYRQCREFMSMEYQAYIPLPREVDWVGKNTEIRRRIKG
ncbi:MAG: hypothetical protein KGI71_06015 [Patescibacteria group bacterium]|nr:hypothetical protein [Patescibacteria group bacterium]